MYFDIYGGATSARVFTEMADEATVGQVQQLCNLEIFSDAQIRIMPDCHAGKGCVVGTTIAFKDAIVPNLVGVDIGCGMLACKIDGEMDFEKLDAVINQHVPHGFSIHEAPVVRFEKLNEMIAPIDVDREYKAIGSLGGGNHFIEINKDEDGYWLVIHSGSRHLGVETCKYHQSIADELHPHGELSWLDGQAMEDYLHDMRIAQEFAVLNRQTIADIICSQMDWKIVDKFETIHNYIDTEAKILRKGAVSARLGERLLIPMNMRDGSLLCVGKGSADWNYSAPHGAGRVLSRGQAKRQLDLADFEKTMDGIYSTSVCSATLDEAPMAYKPMDMIVDAVQDSVQIKQILKPVYNFKAH